MLLPQWLQQLAQRWSVRGGKRRRRSGRNPSLARRRVRPRLEALEERLTPSYDVLTFSGAASASFVPNQPSGAMTVQLQDNNGNIVTATSNVTVKLSSSSSTAEFLDLSSKQLANSSIVIPAGSNFALFEYEDSQTGGATITGQSSSPLAFGASFANVQNRLAFSTSSLSLAPGQTSPPITIQLLGANGNAVNAPSNLTINLSDTFGTGKFFDSSGHPLTSNSITIAAGASSASFEFENSNAGFDNIEAITNTAGAPSTALSVNVKYTLAFTSPLQNIAANSPSGPITLQLQDGKGNAATAASNQTISLSTFSTTGKFLDTSGNPLTKNTTGGYNLTIAAGASSASFKYEDSQTGASIITASSGSGLLIQQQINIGTPLLITTPPQTITPNKASQPITLQLAGAATNAVTINLSSTSTTGKFLDTSGNPLPSNSLGGYSLTIAAGASSASFEYEDSQTGLPTISANTIAFGGFAQQQESVGLSLQVTTAPQTVAQGQLSQPITVQLQDSNGKPLAAPGSTSVQLSSSNGGQFFDSSGNPLFSLTIASGDNSASFTYKNSFNSGTDTITMAIGSSGVSGTLTSTTQQLTVTPAPFTPFIVSTTQTIAPDKPSQPITVQLQNNGNAVNATSNLTIQLSSSSSTGKFLDTSGKPLSSNSITIAAGSSSASFEYEDSQEWVPILTATVNGVSSPIPLQQTVNVGGVSMAFTTAAQTIKAGQPSGPFTVQFKDSQGNAVKAPSDTSLSLSSSSFQTGKFLDTAGKALPFPGITVSAGSSSASFEYEDTVGGKPTLTVTGNGVNTTQQETVNGPYTVAFSSSGQPIGLNQPSQPITIALYDSTHSPATPTSAVTVTLSSTSSGGKFLDTSGKALTNNSITIPAGSGSASFEYEDSQTGFATLTASENGFTSSLQEAAGVSFVFTTKPQTLTAGQLSKPMTVQLQDSSGKAFAAPSDMTISLGGSFGGNGGGFLGGIYTGGLQFFDTSGSPLAGNFGSSTLTLAKGSSSASFELETTWGGTLNLVPSASTASTAGSFGVGLAATQQETVQGLAALTITTSPQTVTAGQMSQLVTLQLQDNNGKPANAPTGGLTIDLSNSFASIFSTGASLNFFDANGNPLPKNGSGSFTLTMPAGSNTVSFKFESTLAAPTGMTAQVQNGFSAEQTETVQAGSPDSVAFVTPTQPMLAGTPSGSITVQVKDKYGNVIPAGSGGLSLNLSSTSSSGKFLSVSGDPLASPSITIPPGASSATFEYEDNHTGTPTLTVSASGVSGTQQETITSTANAIHVSNTNDSGAGSLRAAITAADNNPGSTIVFDSGVTGTIDLLSDLPAIFADTNIIGPGANLLTLSRSSSATGTFGGFIVGIPNTTNASFPEPIVTISGLTVANFNDTGIANYGSLTLKQVAVSNNNASNPTNRNLYDPGGIYNGNNLTVLGSTIANNTASNGLGAAGIESFGFSFAGAKGTNTTIINSTISGNVNNDGEDQGGAGGIFVGGTAYIASSTISGNKANQHGSFPPSNVGSGGGIDASGTVMLYNTIVAGNTGSPNNPTDVSGTFTSLGNNLIGMANTQSSGFVSSDLVGTTTKPIDPKLGALADNGGPTPTMALLTGSPAIAAGNSANAPATDQRGDARSQGAIDIGAVELTTTSGPVAPAITGNPTTQSAVVGDNVSFTASANGNPTPTVQWQLSTDNGKTFNNISGATSTTLTLNNVALSMNNNEYRAVFTNTAGRANTSAATLKITEAAVPPSVSGDPSNQTVTVTTTATFTASANGSPTPTVQWQVSTDGGKTFTNISGATSTTLTLTNVTKAMSGNEYQAVFTNSSGSAITKAATLTVTAAVAPAITGTPSNQTATAGQSATFTASASGAPIPTVQWQVSTDGGKTFTNLSGATNTTLTLNNVTTAMNGDKYHAVFTNAGGSVTSAAASLTVHAAPPPPHPSTPSVPPVLQTPPLLQFLNSLFGGGTVTINADGTETVTDSFFGIPLIVSTFDSSGKLVDAKLFGIDITFLILLL